MKRRDVIRGMGLSVGYAMASPALLSLLQSCTTDTAKWTPVYLSADEGTVLFNLVDLILPRTEKTPGALEVNVPEFIDLHYGKVLDEEDQLEFKNGWRAMMSELQIPKEKSSVTDIGAAEYDKLLAKYLRMNKAEQEVLKGEERLILKALVNLRSISLRAYLTSEKIGKEVMAYDPIPGVQLGCVSLEEATGGKKWSF